MLLQCASDPHRVIAGDAHYVFASARSLAYDGDLDLSNQYLVMGDRWGLGRDPSLDGWRLPAREIGASLLMVPGLWLHAWFGLPAVWEPACACLLASASLGLCWLACAHIAACVDPCPRRAALTASAAVFAFVVPYYACVSAGYNHAPDAAVGACICWALVERGPPVRVGGLLACAVLLRMQNLLWLLWPLHTWASHLARREQPPAGRSGRELMQIAGIAALGFSPQLWLGLAHPGSARGSLGWTLAFFDVHTYGWDLLRVLGGAHGLLSWTPVALLAVFGLARGSEAGRVERGAWLVLLAFAALFASVRDVDGGTAFGARRFAGCVGVLALGLAQLDARLRQRETERANRALRVLLVVAVAANLWRSYTAATGVLSLAPPDPPPSARKSAPSQR